MDRLLSGRRVLVVEDEMLVLIMIEDMLADLGCKSVTSGATVEKAVALINAQVFDVAILDMNLNRNDSHAVADALAAPTSQRHWPLPGRQRRSPRCVRRMFPQPIRRNWKRHLAMSRKTG
jgi:CheY-like chemotaxis protein